MKTAFKYLMSIAFMLYFGNLYSQTVSINANLNLGAPAKYSYYYYPEYKIYQRVETGAWFVFQDGIWVTNKKH